MSAPLPFGSWLRQQRKTLGLSHNELANALGYSSSAIGKIERQERYLSRQAARQLATLLHLSPEIHDAFVVFARTGSGAEQFVTRSDTTRTQDEPASSLSQTNLPMPLTSLVGRNQQTGFITQRLLLPDVHLLTLTGPPGIGKTRLGIQVARHACQQFADGVCFVELASITNASLVVTAIARTLGLQEIMGQPLLEQLKGYLHDKCILLVLDNFEQVIEVSPSITALLAAAPHVKALVTSRIKLHVYGEHLVEVPPLALPEAQPLPRVTTLAQFAAVDLFVQRAQAIRPDLMLTRRNAHAIAAIVTRLDGIPLAIELAAAKSEVLTPSELLIQLDHRLAILIEGAHDLPLRQQTLRAAIDWSYHLLSEIEQTLFARMGVFVGSCTLEAVEAVCDDVPDCSLQVLETLIHLIAHSLLQSTGDQQSTSRLRMLETLREYACEQLHRREEYDLIQQRHAAYYLSVAETAAPELVGPQQAAWIDHLEQDYTNVRAALVWGRDQQDSVFLLRMCAALWRFWQVRGYLSEGRSWLEETLALQPAETVISSHHDATLRATVLRALGGLAHDQGDFSYATTRYEAGLAVFQQLDDDQGIAETLNDLGVAARSRGAYTQAAERYEQSLAIRRTTHHAPSIAVALNNLGNLAHLQGAYGRATELFTESLTIQRSLGDTRNIADVLKNLGMIAREQGDYKQAIACFEESVTLFQGIGDRMGLAYGTANIGLVAQYQGNLTRAIACFQSSLAVFRELGDKWGIASMLNHLGEAARCQGAYEEAVTLCTESLDLFRSIQNTWGIAWAISNLGDIVRGQGAYAQSLAFHHESLALRRDLGDQQGIAFDLEGIADVYLQRGEPRKAVQLLGTAEALRETINAPLPPAGRLQIDVIATTARQKLDETTFDAARAYGRAMPVQQAIAEALARQLNDE